MAKKSTAATADPPTVDPAEKPALDIPVEWGGVAIGDGTGRIGVKIDRSVCNPEVADEMFAGRRLTVRMIQHPPGDDPKQTYIPGTKGQNVITCSADVKGYSANAKRFGIGLTLNLQEVHPETIAPFAKRSGRLQIIGIEQLADGGDDDDLD